MNLAQGLMVAGLLLIFTLGFIFGREYEKPSRFKNGRYRRKK